MSNAMSKRYFSFIIVTCNVVGDSILYPPHKYSSRTKNGRSIGLSYFILVFYLASSNGLAIMVVERQDSVVPVAASGSISVAIVQLFPHLSARCQKRLYTIQLPH